MKNFTGLDDSSNNYVRGAGMNAKIFEGERFSMDMGVTYLDAQKQTIDDFATAGILSAEKNQGAGFTASLNGNLGVWQANLAWSTSCYENPTDEFDSDDLGLVELIDGTANAYTFDFSYVEYE
ncbi:hypothetical protein BK026_05985 [Alteromonas sp. V450]|uniref:hypothetical protein n=1 Tax=Alteromonas sp. V450 TaxID=1912139 RepID=UPI0008FF6844|nr:hypothetical protein [Alteromonas sp. V450]OJF68373.1 hypothetical protein BK026_05985 [Alteromonas sp. V450]